MRVFDTATLPTAERADAVSDAMLDATLSTSLVHHDPLEVWLRQLPRLNQLGHLRTSIHA